MLWAGAVAAFVLASVHLLAGRLRFLDRIPRSQWLSAAAGVSIAYVFAHLLPELAERQTRAAEAVGDRALFLAALAGFAALYGLERAARTSRDARQAAGRSGLSRGVFALHLASFTLYNLLVGYLLAGRRADEPAALAIHTVAMSLHFVVNDSGLRDHDRAAYHHTGRWYLAAAPVVGWSLGAAVDLGDAGVSLLLAFLAGGVILNSVKEELPSERKANFWAFLGGAAGYSALLLAAE